MKILVEALETYKKNNIRDNELGRVPEPGERFEVTEERLKVLLGNNTHNQVFVKVVEEKIKKKTRKIETVTK